jgi:predicted CXXCH cytochrome family protein
MTAFLALLLLVLLAAATPPAAGARSESAAVAPTPGAAAVSAAAGRCGVCHPAERVQFERSLHRQEEVRCVSCHGGDDRSLEASVAHGRGWRGRIPHRDIPALCASCHADEARMRAYNLPVDQYALYQTSGHGQRLAQGDARVAVCSDCHGAHEILPPSDPASSIYVLNVPRTCGRCHGDAALLKQRGLPDNFHAYEKSVHARELYEKGNLRAPTCVSCHGVHGAAPPSLGDVDKVCGQCHTAERRYYTAGAHHAGAAEAVSDAQAAGVHAAAAPGQRAAAASGLRPAGARPECVDCHDAHGAQAAQPERLASSCAQCHEGDAPRLALGQRIWNEYRAAAAEVDQAAALVARADAIPIQTEDYRARLEEARTYLREALPAAHSVEEHVVAGFTARARSVGQEVQQEIQVKLGNLRLHRFLLVLFWFYVLLTLYVLKRFRDQAARQS